MMRSLTYLMGYEGVQNHPSGDFHVVILYKQANP